MAVCWSLPIKLNHELKNKIENSFLFLVSNKNQHYKRLFLACLRLY